MTLGPRFINECGFDSIFKEEYDWHMSDYHGWPSPLEDETGFDFTCKNCEQKFKSIWSLMNHRKEIHSNIVNVCKYFLEDRCEFPATVCWFRHDSKEKEKMQAKVLECGLCVKTFKSKSNLMYHRKESHVNIVKMCRKGSSGCTFGERCWCKHVTNKNHFDISSIFDSDILLN